MSSLFLQLRMHPSVLKDASEAFRSSVDAKQIRWVGPPKRGPYSTLEIVYCELGDRSVTDPLYLWTGILVALPTHIHVHGESEDSSKWIHHGQMSQVVFMKPGKWLQKQMIEGLQVLNVIPPNPHVPISYIRRVPTSNDGLSSPAKGIGKYYQNFSKWSSPSEEDVSACESRVLETRDRKQMNERYELKYQDGEWILTGYWKPKSNAQECTIQWKGESLSNYSNAILSDLKSGSKCFTTQSGRSLLHLPFTFQGETTRGKASQESMRLIAIERILSFIVQSKVTTTNTNTETPEILRMEEEEVKLVEEEDSSSSDSSDDDSSSSSDDSCMSD